MKPKETLKASKYTDTTTENQPNENPQTTTTKITNAKQTRGNSLNKTLQTPGNNFFHFLHVFYTSLGPSDPQVDSVISLVEVMGRKRFDSVCVQPLEGVMHRKLEDEKVRPASATREGFYLCVRKTFFAKYYSVIGQ